MAGSRNELSSLHRLLQTPPEEVAAAVRRCGVSLDDALLCTPTDIDLTGSYRDHWLVVTSQRLLVVCDGTAPVVVRDFSLADA